MTFATGSVGQPLVERARTIPPSDSYAGTRLGHIAARDLKRHYAARVLALDTAAAA